MFAADRLTQPTTPRPPSCSSCRSNSSSGTAGARSHTRAADFSVRVAATGSNSFNANPASGFFSVEAGALTASDPIVSVEFDCLNSTNAGVTGMVFDTDQVNMANTFWEGNSGGCQGTYRNGSDVTAGLDVGNVANNLSGVNTCATSVPHCEATNVSATANSYSTLKWYFTGAQFTTGVVFEFDVDTDGGNGVSGPAMAGLVVNVTLLSGTVLTGELAVDPNDPTRSVLIL